jgi:hypothetical protein
MTSYLTQKEDEPMKKTICIVLVAALLLSLVAMCGTALFA